MNKFFIILLIATINVAPTIGAQVPGGRVGPCPSGSAPMNGSCGSPSNAGGNYVNTPSFEQWENRFGALARNESGTKGVPVENELSKRKAESKALRECGKDCRIVSSTRNGCQVVVAGEGREYYGRSASLSVAIDEAKRKCANNGDDKCIISYEGCSLPVRVR